MTPDQAFARWVRLSLIAFVVLFVYFLVADLWMPLTPQGRVMHNVVQVAPQVNGQVAEIHVSNNQHVEAGERLFTLDQRPFQLAIEKAELALEAANIRNDQYDAALANAEAALVAARATETQLARDDERLQRLKDRGSVSRQQADQIAAEHDAATANVRAAQAKVKQMSVQRGLTDQQNLRLRQARNDLAQARLNLTYSEIRAEESGTVSNLQVKAGTYARAGTSLAALVDDRADVVADFREKSLAYVRPGDEAAVVFDAIPGEVFRATVGNIDAGTRQGQLMADGTLAAPVSTDRWVREAQRERLHLTMADEQEIMEKLPSGARATVQLFPGAGPASWFGKLQIRAISLIHYIY